jgi:hypothetical protein
MVMVLNTTSVRSGHCHRSTHRLTYPTAAKPTSPGNIPQTEGEILVRTYTVHVPELTIEKEMSISSWPFPDETSCLAEASRVQISVANFFLA